MSKTDKKSRPGRVGRPRKAVRQINPVRQIGRWTDEDWEKIRQAARAAGLTVAGWAKRVLKRAARRRKG